MTFTLVIVVKNEEIGKEIDDLVNQLKEVGEREICWDDDCEGCMNWHNRKEVCHDSFTSRIDAIVKAMAKEND